MSRQSISLFFSTVPLQVTTANRWPVKFFVYKHKKTRMMKSTRIRLHRFVCRFAQLRCELFNLCVIVCSVCRMHRISIVDLLRPATIAAMKFLTGLARLFILRKLMLLPFHESHNFMYKVCAQRGLEPRSCNHQKLLPFTSTNGQTTFQSAFMSRSRQTSKQLRFVFYMFIVMFLIVIQI